MDQRTSQEIVQERIAERTKCVGNVAIASASVAKQSFLSTIRRAETFGERAVTFASLTGLLAFFLPWASVFGAISGSGLDLASHVSAWFWLYPVSMVACFVMMAMRSIGADTRIRTARWFILIGTAWMAPSLFAMSGLLSGTLSIGWYVATASAAAILLGGFIQISEQLAIKECHPEVLQS